MNRTRAAAAPPSVIGGPGSDFIANTTTIELAPDAYDSSRRKPDMIESRHLAVSLLEKRREVAGKIRCPQMRLEDV